MTFNPVFSYKPLFRWAEDFYGRDHSNRVPVNLAENETGYLIQLEAPGVKQEDVEVDLENGILTVKYQRKFQADDGIKALRNERPEYDVTRSFRLSDSTDAEKVTAEIRNGVLLVHVPRAEKAQPKKITVKVSE